MDSQFQEFEDKQETCLVAKGDGKRGNPTKNPSAVE